MNNSLVKISALMLALAPAVSEAARAWLLPSQTVLARSGSTDSLTLEGPLGRATLGLRPAGLIRVLPGEAETGLELRPDDAPFVVDCDERELGHVVLGRADETY